jgi:signal transduction histidine kinase/ActR/RegA family two-component response regulator
MLGQMMQGLHRTVFDFQPDAAAQQAMADFLGHLKEHQPPPTSYEIKAVREDSQVLDLSVDWDYLRDETGQATGFVSILTDITERKRAEEEQERLLAQIRQQAQQMQRILDTVPEGVLLLDADERIVQANPLGEKDLTTLSGAQVGDVLTRLGDRPLAQLLTSPPRGLWHQMSADERSFQVIARPIETDTANAGWVVVIRDVTQQREVQRRVQQQERLAAVGQLAAGIAHDFNNIMATVVLYAQLTSRETGLPARVRQRMDTINQQAEHATNLIQQILDFGRRAVLERRPLDLAPLMEEHTTLLRRTLPESIALTLIHEPEEYATPLTVRADPTRMQQMLTNLALNARDAMPAGGTLSIHLERLVIDDELEIIEGTPLARKLPPEIAPGEWIRIRVADTGAGIPPDVLPHIFEPFFTTKAPLGSGLGLAQVHGIVAQHEGVIDVMSQPDQGTTFIIYLPAHRVKKDVPSTPAARRELPPLPQGAGETILVAEDDPIVRQTLVESLEMLNYRTLEAVNGSEALEILEASSSPSSSPPIGGGRGGEEEIALILSDVVMPGMGGIAMLHALRERGSTVKVMLLTGHPMQKELEELQTQGMIAWLRKPPRLGDLAKTIARVLREPPS